ncbi:HBL387Wp [Eremothecium sinecaudum]|uniref:HBL387Wp n=1 Tax=Eremothecium sinecaudum TaxID=45286 RepID=A0A109UVX1_9SACH|nr:HBL387Wp [Eremothecium sinecaudum]AMD18515.1 HBL387Wp [Eremothecium sinecaudum]
MDTLKQLLNLKELEDGTSWSESPVATYLEDVKRNEVIVDPEMIKEVQELQLKENLVEQTLSEIIPPMKEYLNNFHTQLEVLTKDLSFIKGKSKELNRVLEDNSKKLAEISPLVNDLVISPEIVNQVLQEPVNASFTECLAYLIDKQEIYNQYKEKQTPVDFKELQEILQLLKAVCVEKSRKFIIARIKRLRQTEPISSQQIQAELLEVREIFHFIAQENLSLALELRQAYTYTIRWYYTVYFSRYIRSLTILKFVNVTDQFALGQGLSSSSSNHSYSTYLMGGRSLLGTFNNTWQSDQTIHQYFQVGKRLSILQLEDTAVMVSQIAENNNMPNYLEIGFKNLNLAILDNCSVEFMFLNDFFTLDANDSGAVRGLVEQIFKATFDNALKYTEQLIANTYDIFGVLISIRIVHYLQFEAQRRKLPVVDDFLNGHLLLLWPKFQKLVDFHCEKLRAVPPTTNVAQAQGYENDPLVSPHELTVQFSKFLNSMLMLSISEKIVIDEKAEPHYNSIIRIRDQFESVLNKCSKKSSSPEKFLFINYMYLLNALQQAGGTNQSDIEPLIIKDTREHLNTMVELYGKS